MLEESPAKLTDVELAAAVGVHNSQISRWRAKGCPTTSVEAIREWRSQFPGAQQRFNNKNGAGNTLQKRFARQCPPKNSPGPKMTPELVEEVAKALLYGFNYEEVALLCGINEKTVSAWCSLEPVKRALYQRKRELIEKVIHGTRPDWARLCWFLERRYPLEFSRPEIAHMIRHQTTNNSVVNNLIISTEMAAQLAQRSAATSKQIDQLFANHQQSNGQPKQLMPGPSANQPLT
jgi:hypothetical protein